MSLLTILLGGYFISTLASEWEWESYDDSDFEDYDNCEDCSDYDY